MKKWVRKIYLFLAILIFLSASTFFILLSLGYTYNFSKNRFEKTSVLYIKSYPRDSKIFLNDKESKYITPSEITHLKPNLYKIRVEKENYQTWEKTLLIKPRQTVFIEDISLFYNEPETEIIKEGNFQGLSISPDKQRLLFYDWDSRSINTFDLSGNQIINIETEINQPEYNLWSANNQKILLKIGEEYFISSVYLNEDLLALNKYIKFSIHDLKWDKFNSDLIYFLDLKNNVYSFVISTREFQLININNVWSYKPEKDKLFYVLNNEGKDGLYLFDFKKQSSKKLLALDKISNNYSFILPHKDYICLLDEDNDILYLIDPNLEDYLVKTIEEVRNAKLDLYNRMLLMNNNLEIWFYDIAEKREILVNRFSQPIDDYFWHRNNNHVFYVINEKLYAIELDNRDKKNIYNLNSIYNSDYFLQNKKGNIVYHITPAGLTKTTIQ